MANNQNLIPTNKRSKSEARALGKKGGIASGKARRDKRRMQDILNILLEKTSENGLSVKENIAVALVKQAEKGNVKAFVALTATTGEKEPEKVSLIAPLEITIKGFSKNK